MASNNKNQLELEKCYALVDRFGMEYYKAAGGGRSGIDINASYGIVNVILSEYLGSVKNPTAAGFTQKFQREIRKFEKSRK